jgi:hypothetical protein
MVKNATLCIYLNISCNMLLQMSAIDCGKEAVEVFECNVDTIMPQFSAHCSLLCAQLAVCLCVMMFLVCKRNGNAC